MNIAKNMEAIFVVTLALCGMTTLANAGVNSDDIKEPLAIVQPADIGEPKDIVEPAAIVEPQGAMAVITVTGHRDAAMPVITVTGHRAAKA